MLEKNARDTPFTEKLAILIGFVRRTKKHITMHLLVGSNQEATSASSAYVDGRIAWPNRDRRASNIAQLILVWLAHPLPYCATRVLRVGIRPWHVGSISVLLLGHQALSGQHRENANKMLSSSTSESSCRRRRRRRAPPARTMARFLESGCAQKC